MGRLADARDSLFLALEGVLPEGRVHRVTPSTVAAPAVWLDTARVEERSAGNGVIIVATFPAFCVVDGAEKAQLEELDETVARVWDAAEKARNASPARAQAQPLDVGGPSLRATVVDLEVVITSRTLCAPT